MKTLIVFEDTYGIVDIFRKLYNIEDDYDRTKVYKATENLYYIVGQGQRCALAANSKVCKSICNKIKPECIVSIFDFDNLENNNNIITEEQFNMIVRHYDSKIKHVFVPIVYCAETIMLHQFLVVESKYGFLSVVHDSNVKNLHLGLLKFILKCGGVKAKPKRVHEYLNVKQLKLGFSENNIIGNNIFKEWLNGDMQKMVALSKEETLNCIKEVTRIYNDCSKGAYYFKYQGKRFKVDDKFRILEETSIN